MRLTVLLLLGLLAAPAAAQLLANAPHPIADLLRPGGDPEPDTTDWHRYFPLEIGNAWQYRAYVYDEMGGEGGFYFSREVFGDTLIDNETWMVLRLCLAPLSTDGSPPPCLSREFVRYDKENKMLLRRGELLDGTPVIEWWGSVPCRLDAAFNAFVECTGPGTYDHPYNTYGGHGYTLSLPPDVIEGVTAKGFVTGGTEVTTEVAAGVGPVYYSFEASLDHDVLVWARVGGEEYGERYFDFPTVSNEAPPEAEAALALSAYPNPFRDRLTAAFEVARAGPVVVEVVDVLGRVVRRRDLGVVPPGRREVALGGEGLPAGLYVVRLAAGEERAVRRVVRVR